MTKHPNHEVAMTLLRQGYPYVMLKYYPEQEELIQMIVSVIHYAHLLEEKIESLEDDLETYRYGFDG